MKVSLLIVALCLSSASAFAGVCAVTTTRTACPGQEAASYAKCPGGAQSCTATSTVNSEADCAAAALSSCTNTRLTITKYKKIVATFNGVDFDRGLDFCDRDNGSYKVRDNFPYRDSADCK